MICLLIQADRTEKQETCRKVFGAFRRYKSSHQDRRGLVSSAGGVILPFKILELSRST